MDAVTTAPLRFGLSGAILQQLEQTFAQFPAIAQVRLYGSRATGTFRPQSDIDLAISAPTMTERAVAELWNALDDLPILFKLDVTHSERTSNPALRRAIATEGVVLYPRP